MKLSMLIFGTFIMAGMAGLVQPTLSQNMPTRNNLISWDQLRNEARSPSDRKSVEELQQLVSLKDAEFLLEQLSDMKTPDELSRLSNLQKEQDDWGGSFYGAIPGFTTAADSIPLPEDFSSRLKAAIFLARKRAENLENIRKATPEYPISFLNKPFPSGNDISAPANMYLEIDLSVIRTLLDLFKQDSVSHAEALRLAQSAAFASMLRHRRELGYVPPPLPTTETLADFIQMSASKKPLDMIWKWLNPWNDFNLAELYTKQDKYRDLLNTLRDHKDDIGARVLSRIAKFAPEGINFSDRITVAINWGIRSWATSDGLGTNIVFFKDNYNAMLQTVTHETYHRLQLQVCPVDFSRKGKHPREFEDLTFHSFPDTLDQRFYESLSYIFLEGTATLVGGVESDWQTTQKAQKGIELLQNMYNTLYRDKDTAAAEALENKGLRSNGPFYGLGYYMALQIVRNKGAGAIGKILPGGPLDFFQEYLQLHNQKVSESITFSEPVKSKIYDLASEYNKNDRSNGR